MSAVMELQATKSEAEFFREGGFVEFCKALVDQAVDAFRTHKEWVPFQQQPGLFGYEALDPKLVVELSWVFEAEGKPVVSFDLACEELGLNPQRFRRICRRNYPRECAWLESHIGVLRD